MSSAARKVALFATTAFACLACILFGNQALYAIATGLSADGQKGQVWSAVRRLHALPEHDRPAMSLVPGEALERAIRRAEVHFLKHPDVLVLGQSHVDHISSTAFREPSRFFNGYISSSTFDEQRELFHENAVSNGLPELVLLGVSDDELGDDRQVGTPYEELLQSASKEDGIGPWYKNINSLLSYPQTKQSLTTLWTMLRKPSPQAGKGPSDTPFPIDSANTPSDTWRNLRDGSRVFRLEEPDGTIHPVPGYPYIQVQPGRHVNDAMVQRLSETLDALRSAGARVIVFAPPRHLASLAWDARNYDFLRDMEAAVRPVVEARGFDYCNLAAEGEAIGCAADDFMDTPHFARHCANKVLKRLAEGCARRYGPLLRSLLAPEVL